MILLTGQEVTHASTIRTFAVTLSAEMAPAATILVYHVGKFGDVVADSLTFPVNGISRNNVSFDKIIKKIQQLVGMIFYTKLLV